MTEQTATYQSRFTYEEQLEELARLIDDCHVRKNKNVRGEYASNDYVTWRLNQIFTPAGWNFEILTGPAYTQISDAMAFIQMTGRLTVKFADGSTAFRDEVGIWPMYAKQTNDDRLLEHTPPEMYELAYKAVLSDCVKACAERFGNTFRPLLDSEFAGWMRYQQAAIRRTNEGPSGVTAQEAIEDLYGDVKLKPRDEQPAQPVKVGRDPAELTTPKPTAHWISNDKVRARFWALAGDLGLDNEAVHSALGVEHVEEYRGTMQEAKALLEAKAKRAAGEL